MAGLFFYHNQENIKSAKVFDVFRNLEYKSGKFLIMGDWHVCVFPKLLYDIDNYQNFNNGESICGIGTFAYKGKFYEQALPLIYQDIKTNTLDKKGFWGSFIILVYVNGVFQLLRDGACLTRLFSNQSHTAFSTSFAGLFESLSGYFTLNKDAAAELLTTGVITGKNTLVHEMQKIPMGYKMGLFTILESEANDHPIPKNRDESVDQQKEILVNFFEQMANDWSHYHTTGKLDVGLTGGMDSRLMAILALKKFHQKTVLHTHWRKAEYKDKDFKFAHIFAEKTGTALNAPKVVHPLELADEDLMRNYYKGYCLTDGCIRPGAYWDEPYSTAEYRQSLTHPPYLRLLGFGGEQYRNGERLPQKSLRSLHSWIKWEMMYQFAGSVFDFPEDKKRIQQQIHNNISGFIEGNCLNLKNFREYIRRVQSPDYRSLQAQMENRLGFAINPFMDTQVSVPAQNAIPFLGKSIDFQPRIMSQLSEDMASIPNSYGFSFAKGEPFRLKLGALIWQYLPTFLKYPAYRRLKNNFRSDYIPNLSSKSALIRKLELHIAALNLPIDYSKYRLVRSRSKLALNLGYFIERNKHKIRIS